MKPVASITAVFLMLVAVTHLFRILLGIDVTVQTFVLPMWTSVVGTIVPGILAVMLWREARR